MNSAEILKSTDTDTFSQNLISSDTDLLNKVKQVIELTGCSNDIAVTTLYDSNYNVEIAIDKIFEQTQRTLIGENNKVSSDWKEVAKYKKKPSLNEITLIETNTDIKDTTENKISNDKHRAVRGNGRSRGRYNQNNGRNYDSINSKPQNNGKDDMTEAHENKNNTTRGRGRRSQYRVNSNRGRPKHINQDNFPFVENLDRDVDRFLPGESNKWNASYDVCNDWLSDNTTKSNEYNETDRPFDNYCNDVSQHNLNSALNMESFENNLIESCIETEKNNSKDDMKANHLNPLELVANCTNKVDIFGGFSRTKPPALSTKVPLEPVKLLTSNGVKSIPVKSGFNFSFGLNFNEYSQSTKSIDSSESFISKIISNQPFDGISSSNKNTQSSSIIIQENNRADEFLQSNFSENESQLSSGVTSSNPRISGEKSVIKSKSDLKTSDMFSSSNIANQCAIDHSEKKLLNDPNTTYKIPDCVSNNHQSLNTTILSSSSQLCPPPGMSNAHLLQQFQNNPQYFSLLNIPNGSSIFSGCNMNQVTDFADIGAPEDNQVQQSFMHSDSNKEFNQKSSNSKHNTCNVQAVPNSVNQNQQVMLSKISDSDNNGGTHSSTILSAMPMSNICCFPQVYMNNLANFMPTVPGHNSLSQSAEVTQASVPNKQIFNLPTAHRNYPIPDEYMESSKFDELLQKNQKFQRSQPYVSNYVGKSQDDSLDVDKSTKLSNNTAQINRQSNQPQSIGSSNRTNQQQQQAVSNDPRFLAFHHQHSNHPYQNNMFNCVTATGAHPAAPHPYAMAHQGGGLQQLHPQLQLMQQQMHNFPQSYQFPDHLMTSMVSNPSSRSNISQGSGSSGNQSRSNRSTNQLWHPSN